MPIKIADYPQLLLVAWNRQKDSCLDEWEALALYERNWRFVDEATLDQKERDFINHLVQTIGHGVLHV